MSKYFGGGGEGSLTSGIIRDNLAALTSLDNSSFPNGVTAYVIAEREYYQLDTLNPLTTYSPLIVARGSGNGKWYRRSRAYVVGNFTLWCQSFGFGGAGYTPGQLLVSGNTEPDIKLNLGPLPAGVGQQELLPDNLGNLWLATNDGANSGTRIRKYLLKDCLVSGSPVASVSLTPPAALTESGSIIFDRQGGLWSCNGLHGTFGSFAVVRYGQRAYSRTGGVITRTLSATAPAVVPTTSNQQDMLFDNDGNLWATVLTGDATGPNGGICMYTAAQVLAGGLNTAPTVLWSGSNLSPPGAALGATSQLALAPNGLLWVSCFGISSTIKAWSISGAVSGNPAPAITLTSASFGRPYGIEFDRDGNLWVSAGNASRICRVPAASLAVSGAVVPDVIITPTLTALTNRLHFPNNPDRCGLLPTGSPGAL